MRALGGRGVTRCGVALVLVLAASGACLRSEPRRAAGRTPQPTLVDDVDRQTWNRLPALSSYDGDGPMGAAAIRQHGSGAASLRWDTPLDRPLLELAILTTAREHDQPYEWTLHELEALAVGLDPKIIDVVRHRRSLRGLDDREAAIVQLGREVFGDHAVRPETYRRALALLGESTLVDVVALMGQYAGTAARLTAVNQHMPPGWPQLLPLPYMPDDLIHADSRSRLPLKRGPTQRTQARPSMYGRTLSPEGTGPVHIRRHGEGTASLASRVGQSIVDLTILLTAREYDVQYAWTLAELNAREHGLADATIRVVRHNRPVMGLADKEAALITFGRAIYRDHYVSPEVYESAVQLFGIVDLVDIVGLMAEHVADATLLIAFDQRLPPGQEPLLPLP